MSMPGPRFSIEVDQAQGELHFVAAGRWDRQKLADFSWELLRQSQPFTCHKRSFRVFGDLCLFAVQDRKIAKFMRESFEASAALGVERMAVVCASELVAMQLKREGQAVNLKTFDNAADALEWLRR